MKLVRLLPAIDIAAAPLLVPCAWLMRKVRDVGLHRLPWCKRVLLKFGIFPIRDHYYDPQFDFRALRAPLDAERRLPGIDWNEDEQLALLEDLSFAHEIEDYSHTEPDEFGFFLGNPAFKSGDAEYWYQMVRRHKPAQIFEIGSGFSTRIGQRALRRNLEEQGTACRHVCIEPFEQSWLEDSGVELIRHPVESLGLDLFRELSAGDFLFIDSSHMIRPHGDVLFEYLEVLPSLAAGVIVHIHDIFSPRNYLKDWLLERNLFWNEQYLLEALLTENDSWKIIGALNFLRHKHYEALAKVAPHLTAEREPGSIYLERVA